MILIRFISDILTISIPQIAVKTLKIQSITLTTFYSVTEFNSAPKIYGKPAKLANLWMGCLFVMKQITWTYHEGQHNIKVSTYICLTQEQRWRLQKIISMTLLFKDVGNSYWPLSIYSDIIYWRHTTYKRGGGVLPTLLKQLTIKFLQVNYWLAVFNATFDSTSIISWLKVTLYINRGDRIVHKKTTDIAQVTDKCYHTSGSPTHALLRSGKYDYIERCKEDGFRTS